MKNCSSENKTSRGRDTTTNLPRAFSRDGNRGENGVKIPRGTNTPWNYNFTDSTRKLSSDESRRASDESALHFASFRDVNAELYPLEGG